jgi:hypothetical protein
MKVNTQYAQQLHWNVAVEYANKNYRVYTYISISQH